MKAKIAYILGSDSDFPQVEKGISLLAAHDPVLKEKLQAYRAEQREKVLEKSRELKDKLDRG